MKATKILIVSAIAATLTACIRFDNAYTYKKVKPELRERVKLADVPIDLLNATDTVYRVNANDIKEFAKQHKDVLIHEYLYCCKGKYCANPWAVKKFCEERGITYCIIYTTYDEIFRLNTPTPKLVIDNDFYDTRWQGECIDRFEKDLMGISPKEADYPLYFYFHDGKFVKGYKWYEDIEIIKIN